ncbi:MAG: hypothetical protein V4663_02330 [Bacteroidota bacterium]
MKGFKKPRTSTGDTLTGRAGIYLDRQQRKAADYLNKRTKGLSKKTILFGLFIFTLIVSIYLLYLIISAFS